MLLETSKMAATAALATVLVILLWIGFLAFLENTSVSATGFSVDEKQDDSRSRLTASSVAKTASLPAPSLNPPADQPNTSPTDENALEAPKPGEELAATQSIIDSGKPAVVVDALAQSNTASQSSPSLALPMASPGSNKTKQLATLEAVLSVADSSTCTDNYFAEVQFRQKSVEVRPSSYSPLERLIEEHKKCDDSVFMIRTTQNHNNDSAIMIDRRRMDEVKYFLLQRGVNKSSIKLAYE